MGNTVGFGTCRHSQHDRSPTGHPGQRGNEHRPRHIRDSDDRRRSRSRRNKTGLGTEETGQFGERAFHLLGHAVSSTGVLS